MFVPIYTILTHQKNHHVLRESMPQSAFHFIALFQFKQIYLVATYQHVYIILSSKFLPIVFLLYLSLISLILLSITTLPAETFLVTRVAAPITEPLPIVTPSRIVTLLPIQQLSSIVIPFCFTP